MHGRDALSLRGPLMVYGAYGRTGTMIARVALKRGHNVVLSGSDRDRLNRLSAELGVPGVVLRLDDQLRLREHIRNLACVIHVAGPFASTFRQMLEACSAEEVPYVDLNGELDVFRAMEEFVADQQPSIPVVSGAGFGVVAGESAAMHAASMLKQPHRVWVGVAPDLATRSPGAVASTLRVLAEGGASVQNGQLVSERVGRRSFTAILNSRSETFTSMPLGELWAIRRSTTVSSVIAGVRLPPGERILLRSGVLPLLARSEMIRRQLVAHLHTSMTKKERVFESKVWARAEDAEGQTAQIELKMGEGYQWSAEAAVRVAERVANDPRPGLSTAGQYLGKEFALSIPSTKLVKLPNGAFR
jgi:short subunit dehydrogenase-like uncharacterized protein